MLRGKSTQPGRASYDANHESHLLGFGLVREVDASESVFTARLTNHYAFPIYLRGHAVQYQDGRGQVLNGPRGWGLTHPWVGVTNFDTLLPNEVARVSFSRLEIPPQAKHVRLVFQYFYDADLVVRAASHVATNFNMGKLSPELRYRLYQHGLLTGQHQRSYDSDWVSN